MWRPLETESPQRPEDRGHNVTQDENKTKTPAPQCREPSATTGAREAAERAAAYAEALHNGVAANTVAAIRAAAALQIE
jgi:hypothetical protein